MRYSKKDSKSVIQCCLSFSGTSSETKKEGMERGKALRKGWAKP